MMRYGHSFEYFDIDEIVGDFLGLAPNVACQFLGYFRHLPMVLIGEGDPGGEVIFGALDGEGIHEVKDSISVQYTFNNPTVLKMYYMIGSESSNFLPSANCRYRFRGDFPMISVKVG